MAEKLNLPDIGTLGNPITARAAINTNFTAIENAMDNCLSRDGAVPNQMEADIDLNRHALLNVGKIDATLIYKNGVPFEQSVAYANKKYQLLSGTGAQTTFILADDPGSLGNLYVSVGGADLKPGIDYTYTGTSLVFTAAPAAGTNNIYVRYDKALATGVTDPDAVAYTPPSTGVTSSVKAFLDSLWSGGVAGGSALIRFLRTATGAVAVSVWDKLFVNVDAVEFGVVADGVTDCSTAMQNAINYCAANERTLVLPAGDILLNTGLTHSSGSLHIRGTTAGTQGTRLLIKANAPAITITAQATIEHVGIVGEQNGTKTLQAGVYINNTSNVDLNHVVFDGCYDSIKLYDVCFYCNFHNIRWFSCVRAHVYGTGVSAAGYAVQFSNCQMTPTTGQYGFYLENAGSLILSDIMMSPANLSERCFMLVSNSALAGLHQINNCVFEGSVKEALRVEGTSGSPIKHLQFNNCYFNQSGNPQDAITLLHCEYVLFSNCLISGTGAAAVTLAGNVKYTSFTNVTFPGAHTSAVVRALAGATLDTLNIVNAAYTGSLRFLDLTAITSGNINRVSVSGGYLGSHANPLIVTTADSSKVRCTTVGNTQTRNGGIATFSGTGAISLFTIAHGLLNTPTKFQVVPNSVDAGTAEIREVTVDAVNVYVQCKASAASGTNNVKWSWMAEL